MDIAQDPFIGSELTIILVSSDLGRSKRFYKDVLGANIYREYGGNSIVLGFLETWILLVSPGGPTPDKPNIDFVSFEQSNKLSHAFTIRVKDCQASYKILKERGAEFITSPYQRGAETRCFFRDPDGHLFEISAYDTKYQ